MPRTLIADLRAALSKVIQGKERSLDLLIMGALAGGHVLIEDVPGVGKTTLAKAFAKALSLEFSRVQFTPDLLPSDILGSQIFSPRDGVLSFQRGPIFANLVLADEINRASARTQSALLEAMSEGHVSIDGKSMALAQPFMVLATQNPIDFQGTFPLPEAQLDRFVLRVRLGYPSEEEELKMLADRRTGDPLADVEVVADGPAFQREILAVREVTVRDRVARYIRRIVHATRGDEDVLLGVSPRGTLTLFRVAQAHAHLDGRTYVTPDDVQAVATPTLAHRTVLTERARYGGRSQESVIDAIVKSVEVPL